MTVNSIARKRKHECGNSSTGNSTSAETPAPATTMKPTSTATERMAREKIQRDIQHGVIPMKRFGNIIQPGYFENVIKKYNEDKARRNEYRENATRFNNILMACELSLVPEIEKRWYQKYGVQDRSQCPNKLMTIISLFHNDDDNISMKFEYIKERFLS